MADEGCQGKLPVTSYFFSVLLLRE